MTKKKPVEKKQKEKFYIIERLKLYGGYDGVIGLDDEYDSLKEAVDFLQQSLEEVIDPAKYDNFMIIKGTLYMTKEFPLMSSPIFLSEDELDSDED